MKKLFTLMLLGIPLFALAQQDTLKQDDLMGKSLEELMEVSVASNVQKQAGKQPASVTVISRKQLELSGARSLIEAIMTYVPGYFTVEDQDDLITGFRGLAPDNNSKVLFLLNGQKLNTEWFWGPPSALLNSTNLAYIKKVEVIRGPGSVTLGQGALLGVINIVTRKAGSMQEASKGHARVSYGANGYEGVEAMYRQREGEDHHGSLYFGRTSYNGQAKRNQGWIRNKANDGFQGGKVFDVPTRIHRSENTMLLGNMQYKNLELQVLYADHERDLYNFYRDRNVFGQQLLNSQVSYGIDFSEKLSLEVVGGFAVDNFRLKSVQGPTMGGTRENRYNGKAVLQLNEVIPNNNAAIGAEMRYYEFGRDNFSGNNFIQNVLDTSINNRQRLMEANRNYTMGYTGDLLVYSFFIEDFYSISDNFQAFAAGRFDIHPYWGSYFSPRLGILAEPFNNFSLRFSYQSGFRGAVGLHYSGGYRNDGFLRADNFSKLGNANIPLEPGNPSGGTYSSIDEVQPESMNSFELELGYEADAFSVHATGFYNTIENVIDVGVIYANPDVFVMPAVGTDVPGSWNGYWHFKNTEGTINQAGLELALSYREGPFYLGASHSLVSLLSADEQQQGSMYITENDNFKAYPENVTRLHAIVDILPNISAAAHYLYYYSWYSPRDQKGGSSHMLNLSAVLDISDRFTGRLNARNILGEGALYPMNSNAGDVTLSDGTPTLEKPTYWVSLGYRF